MSHPEIDVLIVGGGPGGLCTADRLARQGVRVIVCEEHPTIGNPVHCTGVLASESFRELDLPPDAVLNDLSTARFVSPSGITVTYSTPSPVATVIDRGAFDRTLAARAAALGVEVRMGLRVSKLEPDRHGVSAAVGDQVIRARLVVLACGANYAMQRRLGLGLPCLYLHTAQRELPAAFPGDVELHFGRAVAPDGFAWAVPIIRPEGSFLRIGAMASDDAVACYQGMLARIGKQWGVEVDGQPPRQKILPIGAIARTYADRVLVVGDAAGLVKPTTGGGIHYSIVSARLAAEVAVAALDRDRLDAEALSAYEAAWRVELDEEFEAQHALRAIATRLSDAEIDSLFDLACTDGIMPIVRRTARFNQHRNLIFELFKHPPARKILFRAIAG